MIEVTFALIKSKAIRRNLHAYVLGRIMEHDFIIQRAEWRQLPLPTIAQFYAEHQGKPYWDDLQRSVSGHVIALVLSRENAIAEWRGVMGATDPRKALPGTLRALAVGEAVMADNIVHGSDSITSADREIRLLFGEHMWRRIKRSADGN